MRGRGARRGAPAASGYQEWAEYLERWSAGGPVDASALGPLDETAYARDTWLRLSDRFTGALAARLELWQAALGRSTAAAGDEFSFGRALQQARTGLRVIRALATDARLPEELRTRLTALVDGQLTSMQEHLEKDVERLRGTGDANRRAEARLRTLRQNPLTAVSGDTVVERAAAPAPAPLPEDVPRRRIVRP